MPARVNPDVPGEAKLLRAVGKRIRGLPIDPAQLLKG